MKNLRIEKLKNLSLAALLVASATFVACSSSDDITTETPQPANPTGKYTMIIKASKGDGATTRALSSDGSGGLNVTWAAGEEVLVYQGETNIGTLTAAASDDAETTLSGTLDNAPDPDEALTFYFHTAAAPSYSGQDGTLTKIASTYDFCAPTTIASDGYTVDDVNNTITVNGGITFDANKQAIVKFTFLDKADATGNTKLSPSAFTVTVNLSSSASAIYQSMAASYLPYNSSLEIPAETYTENGAGIIYLAIPDKVGAALSGPQASLLKPYIEITLTATVGSDTYTLTKSGFPFENGKYYEITAKMTNEKYTVPLTLEAIEDGTIMVEFCRGLSLAKPITYTKNGVAGEPITATTEISVSAGEKVCFYSQNSDLGYDQSEYINIWTHERCYIYGNVMSLIDDSGSGFANDKVIADNTAEYHTTFFRLFEDAHGLENHPSKPILLPATTLAVDCYEEMFSRCTSLTTAPELPAETLADGCYGSMFQGCSRLTTAPELPATTLTDNCYAGMFIGCTSLTTAPLLRATTLADNCYGRMFQGCTNLNYVKCLATDISADYCLDEWLDGVSATGTFVKASGVTWPEGTSGIPSGWTVTTE